MIKGVLIVNNHGSPRLTKFYHPIPNTTSSTSVVRRIFNQVASRPDSFCNYLEGTGEIWGRYGGERERGGRDKGGRRERRVRRGERRERGNREDDT